MTLEMIGGLFLRRITTTRMTAFASSWFFLVPRQPSPPPIYVLYATNETDAARPEKSLTSPRHNPGITIRYHEHHAADYVYNSTPTISITSRTRRLWRMYTWRSSRFVPRLHLLVPFLALLPGFLSSDATVYCCISHRTVIIGH